MGDRGNIHIKDSGVYLYSHWGGYDLPFTLQKALLKKWRWDDHPYLTRIIFDVMTGGVVGKETGFGISTEICDNEYPILTVSVEDMTVSWDEHSWRFSEFVELSEGAIREAWTGEED